MTRGPFLKKADIAHILRAAAGITGETEFTLVGTGAAIAQSRTIPLDMTRTRELDLQLPDDDRGQRLADLIDGSIGEGSQFDATFGYYAHALAAGTAILPTDWASRARRLSVPKVEGLVCVCPDMSDLALSKAAAWREKDIEWLGKAVLGQAVDLNEMRRRLAEMPPTAPSPTEMLRRLDAVALQARRAAPTRTSRPGPVRSDRER